MEDHEIEHLIWLALQYSGDLPPMIPETVEYWEKMCGINPDLPDDVLRVLKQQRDDILRGKYQSNWS